jgi:phage tail-like protein
VTVVVSELPAVYLDAFSAEAAPARLLLVNRNPEPNQYDVPGDQTLTFDLLDTGAAPGINLVATVVTINGVTAYDGAGGGFQPGYAGTESGIQSPAANVRRVCIDPVADLDSEAIIALRVVSATLDTAASLDTSWTFTVADVTAPRILTVEPIAINVVRVAFSEPVGMTEALTAANYTFAGTAAAVPAMPTTGASVVWVSSSVVDVTTMHELSFGHAYEVTAANVLDLFGNLIAPPYDRCAFTSVQPVAPAGRRFDLWQWVPSKNRREDGGDLRKFILCLQDVADLLLHEIDAFADSIDIDYAPEQFVDAMLADLGNPFADFTLTLAEKRRLGRVLVDVYRQKGTAPGIVAVVNLFLGVVVTVLPYLATYGMLLGESELGDTWELGIGTRAGRYAFDVSSAVVLTDAERARIRRIVTYMKPAHTHFVNLLEPTAPVVIDHLVLGESVLGGAGAGNEGTWDLHA